MIRNMKKWQFKHIVIFVFLTIVIVVFVLSGLDWIYPLNLKEKTWSTLITAKDGTPLRAFADKNGVWRYPIDLTEVSPLYLQALLTYEDRWFYYHPGINPFSIIRAGFQNVSAGRIVSGGSTLTMQVARLLHPNKRTLTGKFLQILRALQLEVHLTKKEILTLYLNQAPFGSNIEGVQTACFSWLGKQAAELSHAEAALLAVLPQSPSFYRPDRHPKRARKARDKVLDRMVFFKVWTKKQVIAAKKEPVIALRFVSPMIAPLASRRLYHTTFNNPSKVNTTLDYDLQINTEDIVKGYITGLSDYQSAAAMIVNYKSLDVMAYVGSADFSSAKRKGHVDMVRAIRSPGSTLKPFLYGLAIDEGLIHSHSLLLDTPRFQKEYEPGNFSKGFSGPVSMAKALKLSLNVPAVQVLEAYGSQKFYDRLINAGARLKLSGKPNLSIILGGMGTNLESLVTLYTALARDGITGKPKLLKNDSVQERYLMSPGAAWIISKILAQPMPGFEGINRLSGHIAMAWKTGTSYGFRDAWALGIMGDYVAGVWVGRPDGSSSPGQYGAVTAIPLLRRIFESLPQTDFIKKQPSSVQQIKICWPLGVAKNRILKNCFVQHDAWILGNKIPSTLNRGYASFSPLLKTFWIDKNGNRAQPSCGGFKKIHIGVWPQAAEPWLPPSWRRYKLIPPPSKNCPDLADFSDNFVQITSVFNNSILTRPPGLVTPPSIPITASGSQGKQYWFLNKKLVATIAPGTSGSLPMPGPGIYQLSIADETGNFDLVNFEVISLD